MSSRIAPANLVAFPSVSSSLHSLPHATSLSSVSLHPTAFAHRAAESEAKLQKALSSKATNPASSAYNLPAPSQSPGSSSSAGLMMRKPQKSKNQS